MKLTRKMILGLLCACGLFSTASYSTTMNYMIPGMTIDFELLPNIPHELVNILYWKIHATCKIISNQPTNTILFTAKRRSGSIRGITLSSGQSVELTFLPNEEAEVTADSGAKVELLNKTDHVFTASCTASS